METIMKADIFFFITAVAVIIVAILFVAVLVYVIRIVRNVLYISRIARRESDKIAEDITDLRSVLRTEGKKVRESAGHITERIEEESSEVLDDVKTARKALEKEGGRLWSVFTFFLGFLTMKKGSKKVTRNKNKRSYGTKKRKEE